MQVHEISTEEDLLTLRQDREKLQLLLIEKERKIADHQVNMARLQDNYRTAKEEASQLQHQVTVQGSLLQDKNGEIDTLMTRLTRLESHGDKVNYQKCSEMLEGVGNGTGDDKRSTDNKQFSKPTTSEICSLKEQLARTAESYKQDKAVMNVLLEERNAAIEELEHTKEEVGALRVDRSDLEMKVKALEEEVEVVSSQATGNRLEEARHQQSHTVNGHFVKVSTLTLPRKSSFSPKYLLLFYFKYACTSTIHRTPFTRVPIFSAQ